MLATRDRHCRRACSCTAITFFMHHHGVCFRWRGTVFTLYAKASLFRDVCFHDEHQVTPTASDGRCHSGAGRRTEVEESQLALNSEACLITALELQHRARFGGCCDIKGERIEDFAYLENLGGA